MSVLIALIPIFAIYATPIPGVTLGDLVCLCLILWCVFSGRLRLYSLQLFSPLAWFGAYIVFMTIYAVVFNSPQIGDIFVRSIRMLFYLFTVAIISSSNKISFDKAMRACILVSVFGTLFLLLQYAMYYGYGVVLNGFLHGDLIYLKQYAQIDYQSSYARFFRPTSFFLEPAMFTQYAIVGLSFALFSKKSQRDVMLAILISVGIILSTSSQGIVMFAILWFVFVFREAKTKERRFLLIILIVTLVILLYLFVPFVRLSIIRLLNTNKAGAIYARMGALTQIRDLPLNVLLFGKGFGYVYKVDGISSVTLLIWGTGVLGLGLVMLFFYKNIKRMITQPSAFSQIVIGFIFLLMLLYSNIFNNYMLVYYVFFFVGNNVFVKKNHNTLDKQNKGHLLFTFGLYYPSPSANGICVDKVMHECYSSGYKVSCIVNSAPKVPYYENSGGLYIHRIKGRFSDRIFVHSNHIRIKPLRRALRFVVRCMNKVKLAFFASIWPLTSPLYTLRYLAKIQYLYDLEGFDVLISTYTPIDSLVAGYFFKILYSEIVYVPYFLDALAGGSGPKNWSQQQTDRHTIRIERLVGEKANKMILMQSAVKRHNQIFGNIFVFLRYIVLDIPLLEATSEKAMNKIRKMGRDSYNYESNIKILYMGSINIPQRNPVPILEILLHVLDYVPNITVKFVGNCNNAEVFDDYSKLTNGKISYHRAIPYNEASKLLEKADILINLGNKNVNMVPSKIFDYINTGKPIISTFSEVQDTSLYYLQKYPLSFLLDESKTDFLSIAQDMVEFILNSVGKKVAFNSMEDFYLNTPKAFIEAIEQILRR